MSPRNSDDEKKKNKTTLSLMSSSVLAKGLLPLVTIGLVLSLSPPGSESLLTDVTPTSDSTDTTVADGVWDVLEPGDPLTFTGTYIITADDVEDL